MGAYVNPKGMTSEADKISFLLEHGRTVTREVAAEFTNFSGDELPVVCLDNGMFYAVGIAYDEREVREFTAESDTRPKVYFMVPKDALYANSDLESYLER